MRRSTRGCFRNVYGSFSVLPAHFLVTIGARCMAVFAWFLPKSRCAAEVIRRAFMPGRRVEIRIGVAEMLSLTIVTVPIAMALFSGVS